MPGQVRQLAGDPQDNEWVSIHPTRNCLHHPGDYLLLPGLLETLNIKLKTGETIAACKPHQGVWILHGIQSFGNGFSSMAGVLSGLVSAWPAGVPRVREMGRGAGLGGAQALGHINSGLFVRFPSIVAELEQFVSNWLIAL